jgi:hypothetical protein
VLDRVSAAPGTGTILAELAPLQMRERKLVGETEAWVSRRVLGPINAIIPPATTAASVTAFIS